VVQPGSFRALSSRLRGVRPFFVLGFGARNLGLRFFKGQPQDVRHHTSIVYIRFNILEIFRPAETVARKCWGRSFVNIDEMRNEADLVVGKAR